MSFEHHHHDYISGPRDRPWLERTVSVAGSVEPPVTLEEFAAFLEDPCLPGADSMRDMQWRQFLRTAAEAAISWLDRELLTRSVTTSWDAYAAGRIPAGGLLPMVLPEPLWLTMPRVPADPATVTVALVDDEGMTTTLAADDYDVDTVSEPHRIHLDSPPLRANLAQFRGIQVSYDAGYGATPDTVPDALKLGVMMHAAYLYERRGMEAGGGLTKSGAADVMKEFRVLTGL